MTANKMDEVKEDIRELQCLQAQATRRHVIDILSLEIRRLDTELIRLQDQIVNTPTPSPVSGSVSTSDNNTTSSNTSSASKRYVVKLNGYGWDQSDKFVKVFVTLKDVQKVAKENVHCDLTEKSMELHVKDLDNKDYTLLIKNLLEPIDVSACHWKQKTDMVVIFLAKSKPGSKWSHMTEIEKRFEEKKTSQFKVDEDLKDKSPQDSLMGLVKKMYDSGDDEMKRTIAKAWTQQNDKSFTA